MVSCVLTRKWLRKLIINKVSNIGKHHCSRENRENSRIKLLVLACPLKKTPTFKSSYHHNIKSKKSDKSCVTFVFKIPNYNLFLSNFPGSFLGDTLAQAANLSIGIGSRIQIWARFGSKTHQNCKRDLSKNV